MTKPADSGVNELNALFVTNCLRLPMSLKQLNQAINDVLFYLIEAITIVTRKKEMSQIFKEIKNVDSSAFISVAGVLGVYGNGFDQIK